MRYSLIYLFFITSIVFGFSSIHAQVSVTDMDTPISYDFTGFLGNDDPADWITEDVTSTSDWMGSNNGSSNPGGKYSYGDTGSGASFEGSVGFLPSSSRAINAKIQFANNTGSEIEGLEISYVAEHWRNVNNGQTNGWTVNWLLDGIDQGEIADLSRLFSARPGDDTGENPGGGPWEADLRSVVLSGIEIPSGSTFTIQFFGDNGTGSGARQGVAIDDFSLTALETTSPNPSIAVNPISLDGFEYEEGSGPSTPQSFELSGINLDPSDGDLTVDASGIDYEVSLDDNTFYSSVDVSYSGGELAATDVFVRLKEGLTEGSYSNQIIGVSGGGASSVEVSTSGDVLPEETMTLPSLTAFNAPYNQDFSGFDDVGSLPSGWEVDDNYSYQGPFGSGASGGLRGEGVLGFQLTGSGMNSNFTATLSLVNDIGENIENLEINYLGKVERTDQSGTPHWVVSVDGTEVSGLEYSTSYGEDSLISVLLSGLNIGDGSVIEIEWFTTSTGTSGVRRQIGLTDLEVTAIQNLAVPAVPEFDLAEGTYYEDQTVFISNFGDYGSSVEVRYTLDGSEPGSSSILYDAVEGIDLEDGNGSIELRAVAIDTDTDLQSAEAQAEYTFPINVPNIAAFRQGVEGVLYRITGEVTVLHLASFQNRHFVRDGSGSLILWDQAGNITTTYLPGQGISEVTGVYRIKNNGALITLEPALNPGAATSMDNDISPVLTNLNDLSLDQSGELVRIKEVDFLDMGVFAQGNNYDITDPTVGGNRIFRTDFFDADYIGENIPEQTIDLIALVIGFGSNVQLVSRSEEDFLPIVEDLVVEILAVEQISCASAGDGSIVIEVSGGSGDIEYDWEGPFGFSSSDQNISDLDPGTYSLTVSDEAGQEEQISVEISEPEAPEVSFAINGEDLESGLPLDFPEGTEIHLILDQIIEGLPPFTVNWNIFGSGGLESGSTLGLMAGDTVFSTVLDTGNYQFDLSDITDGDGCTPISEILQDFQVNILPEEEFEFANFIFNPLEEVVPSGEEFEVTVQMDLSLLAASAAEIHLEFDPSLLEVVGLQAEDWGTGSPQFIIFEDFDNSAGTIDFAAFQSEATFPENELIDVFTITFKALAETSGTSVSHITNGDFPSAISFEGDSLLNEAESLWVVIDDCLLFELEAQTEIASCPFEEDASITVLPQNGTAPYTYNWENSASDLATLENIPAGFYEITVIDSNDCEASAIFEVEAAADTVSPEVICPDDVTIDAEFSCAVSIPDFIANATVSDNCTSLENMNIRQVPKSGLTQIAESITVFIVADDESGNRDYCSFLLNLENFGDIPVIDCSNNEITQLTDPGDCGAEVEVLADFAVGCEGGEITNNFNSGGSDASDFYPVGITEVLFELEVDDEIVSTCQVTVEVLDESSPTIFCPSDIEVNTLPEQCFAVPEIEPASAFDNCPDIALTNDAPSEFYSGTTEVTHTAQDASGNESSCVQLVTVNDNESPSIICPENITVTTQAGQCFATPELQIPSASDNCGIASIENDAPGEFSLGSTQVVHVAYDESGNSSSCIQTVEVIDEESPQIFCPDDVSVEIADGPCFAEVILIGATVSDNCGIASIENDASGQYEIGLNLVTYTTTDVSGNTASCQTEVWVIDNTEPEITCPEDIEVSADLGLCGANITDLGVAEASYLCGNVVVSNDAPSSFFELGVSTVVYTATADNGNEVDCEQTITVYDDQNPEIVCPSNVSQIVAEGSTEGYVEIADALVSDNCGIASVENDYNNNGENASDFYPIGITEVNFTATDVNGLTASCQLEIEVIADFIPDTLTVSGKISSAFGVPIGGTQLNLIDALYSETFADTEGNYAFSVLEDHNPGAIPERDYDWNDGVSTLDLIFIQMHILDLLPFDSPYLHIAADASNDGNVSTFDLVLLQNLILESPPVGIPGNTSWRFVPDDYVFDDPDNPLDENWPESKFYQGINQDLVDEDWIAIKVGDVTGDAGTSGSRIYRDEHEIFAEVIEGDGGLSEVVFSAGSPAHLTGYQLEFSFPISKLEFQGFDISSTVLKNKTEDNFFIDLESGIIRLNWWNGNGQHLSPDDELFRLRFYNLDELHTSIADELKINTTDRRLWSEIYNSEIEPYRAVVNWKAIENIEKGEYALLQNQPNPFGNETIIPFRLPEAMPVEFEVWTSDGQLIHRESIRGMEGYNQVKLSLQGAPSGVLYYRLSTSDYSGVKKMLRME